MAPFDFKSPEAETLVLSRFPCLPLCSLARAVVVHRLTVTGMERCSLSMPFVQSVWRTRPCLLTPRRGLAVAMMVRFLCHWHEERGNC